MKNWRDPKDYEFPDDLKPIWWAWEFLRRSARYQEEFREEVAHFQKVQSAGEFSWLPSDPRDRSFRIPAQASRKSPWNWGLPAYFNPDQDRPPLMLFPPGWRTKNYYAGLQPGQSSEGLREPRSVQLQLDPWQAAAVFDLSLPLNPQFERARDYLSFEQQQLKGSGALRVQDRGPQKRLRPMYLLLLDADRDGATPKAIADAFEHDPVDPEKVLDEKKVWDRLQVAREMIEPEGYLAILT